MAPTKVILLSCGSYNPPTIMHLRMFEIARDYLHKMGSHVVIGGVISPVHDAYGKKDLTSAAHRCAMLRLALQNNDWIRLSDWETKRDGWTTTKTTIQHHQNVLNSWIFDTNDVKHHSEIEDMDWIPEKIKNGTLSDQSPIQVKLLCGADLLESFGTPGLWADEDIDAIVGQHGLVVVTREGSNPNQFIYDSDLLSKYMHNILIVTEWITNEISSTKIRRALKRGESVKYLLQDSVLDYIYKHEIHNARRTSTMNGKTCMPSVRQLVDHLVAARSIPIRCGPCLTINVTNKTNNINNNNNNNNNNKKKINNNNNNNLHASRNKNATNDDTDNVISRRPAINDLPKFDDEISQTVFTIGNKDSHNNNNNNNKDFKEF
ncbi:nicotinamide/nicotinic acid mononucleotide adenylyltransferase 3 isoform X3 [Athalia rosae]|uniref:nicotinamide/nicotinic acid mononucleotide adenylyltransferase 3 isoform X3 n=1 Tax=Athalia rosae TaxID=37344 RepID=UPI0020335244|nr:nicotinamide/nicotinic acid mononucleotide adenylyltransferase 3 isoform X3 [Athalia rosae]